MFRGIPRFKRATYQSQPTGGSNQVPNEEASFLMDAKGIASCYDTAAGVGVLGRGADTGKKKKGLHPLWMAFFILAGIVALKFAMKGLLAFLSPNRDRSQQTTGQVIKESVAPIPDAAQQYRQETPGRTTMLEPGVFPVFDGGKRILADQTPPKQIWVVGWVQKGDKINVVLSDGRTLTELDGMMQARQRNFVEFKTGERLWMQPMEKRILPPSQAIVPRGTPPVVKEELKTEEKG